MNPALRNSFNSLVHSAGLRAYGRGYLRRFQPNLTGPEVATRDEALRCGCGNRAIRNSQCENCEAKEV